MRSPGSSVKAPATTIAHRTRDGPRGNGMTTIVTASPLVVAQSTTKYFYLYMALSCAAVAFLGFAPTFWLPMASHTFKANPIVYVHGLVFSSCTLFFVFQTWIASSCCIIRLTSVVYIGIWFASE